MVTIDLSKQARADAVASLKRYFEENMPEPLGELPAGLLLNFILGKLCTGCEVEAGLAFVSGESGFQESWRSFSG